MKQFYFIWFLLITSCIQSQTVFVNPENQVANPGDNLITTIEIENVENLGAFEIQLGFDSDYLQANQLILGDFLGSTGRTVFPLTDNIDNSLGFINFAVTTLGANPPGPNGGGVLIEIHWNVVESVSYEVLVNLIIEELTCIQPNGTIIPVDILNGSIIILGPLNSTIVSSSGCPGSIFVPIEVNGFNEISEFSLSIAIPDGLTYLSHQNINELLDNVSVNDNSNSLEINYQGAPITIGEGILLEIEWDAADTDEVLVLPLEWEEDISYYMGPNGELITSYTNGEVSVEPLPMDVENIYGDNMVCEGAMDIVYSCDEIPNALTYNWELIPSDAGIINGSGSGIIIDFNPEFSGDLTLSIYGSNSCGNGNTSNFSILVIENPSLYSGPNDSICEGNTYTTNAISDHYDSILWSSSGDGVFENPNSLISSYTPGDYDVINGAVILRISSYANQPCDLIIRDSLLLSILPELESVSIPEGPEVLDIHFTPTTDYSTECQYAEEFIWILSPNNAGDITEDFNEVEVDWNPDFQGIAYLMVYAANECNTLLSDSLMITVDNSVGIKKREFHFQIFPNPSPGEFLIRSAERSEMHNYQIINSMGAVLINQDTPDSDHFRVDLSKYPKGVYYLKLNFNEEFIFRKLVLY